MYDLIIIGGGPAGLTAAVYAIHRRLETLLVTEDLGGKANYRMHIHGLEGYETINGEETVRKFQSQLEYLDFARLMDKATMVEAVKGPEGGERYEVSTEGGLTLQTRAIIVATGARPRMLGVPGESDLLGLGVSYSAVSHAPLFWGKDTAVIGSDELALRSTVELASLSSKVYVVAPDPIPTDSPWADKVKGFDNVEILEGASLESVNGGPYLEAITVRAANGETRQIPVQGMFVELGLIPNTELVADLVDRNDDGQILVSCRGVTSREGIFAAGDVTDAYSEQVLIAIGDGAKAALAAYEFLLRHPKHLAESPPTTT